MSSLNSVVNRLVRAAASVSTEISDADLDAHVARILAEEAKANDNKWSELGLGAYLSKERERDSPDPNAPKPNKRFLSSIIRQVDGHNTALLRQQAQAARQARSAREIPESSHVSSRRKGDGKAGANRLFGGALRGLGEGREKGRGKGPSRSGRDRDGDDEERKVNGRGGVRERSRERERDRDRRSDRRDDDDGGRGNRRGRDRSSSRSPRRRQHSDDEDDDRKTRRRHDSDDEDRRERRREKDRDRPRERRRTDRRDRSRSHDRHDRKERPRSRDRHRKEREGKASHRDRSHSPRRPAPPTARVRRTDRDTDKPREPSASPPSPPDRISRMDRYFKRDYDPRLDVGEVPKTGPVTAVGWDSMLAVLKDRGKKRRRNSPTLSSSPEPVRKARPAGLPPKPVVKDTSTSAELKGLMEMEYTRRGQTRAWDVGKDAEDE